MFLAVQLVAWHRVMMADVSDCHGWRSFILKVMVAYRWKASQSEPSSKTAGGGADSYSFEWAMGIR